MPRVIRIIIKYILILAVFFALAVLLFWPPLFDNAGALQWDAREVHLTNLIYSSSVWHNGFLPLWTPYIFSGYPQIADLQVAVFYPINFLIGFFVVFSQKIIFSQLVFHYALAGFGMFLLARHLTRDPLVAIFAGLAYQFSGFMIGHASHLGMQNTAAWLPIVFLLAMDSLHKRSWRGAVFAGAAAGVMILAGHFQTAVFIFFALGIYFIFHFFREWFRVKKPPFYQIALWMIIAALAFLISAVQLLPTFELTGQSQRANISLELAQTESLNPKSLASLVISNYQNVAQGEYHGPWDRTQNDLFLGKIVVLLALLSVFLYLYYGIFKISNFQLPIPDNQLTIFLVTLAAAALLYSLGSYGFLHKYFYLLPLFNKMRAPANMMIIFDFAVILLAAFGLGFLKELWPKYFKIIILAAIVLVAFELLPQAISADLLYARKNPAITFAKPAIVESVLGEYGKLPLVNQFKLYRVPELERNLAQVFRIYDFGGYNPLILKRQTEYEDAMVKNPVLIDLAGIKYLPCEYISSRAGVLPKVGNLCVNDKYFPKAFLADRYRVISKSDQFAEVLREHQDGKLVLLEEPSFAQSDASELKGEVVMTPAQDPNRVEFSARANKPALLFFNQTYYPGWKASVDGKEAKILRADYLFQAIALKEGEHKISLFFTSPALKSGVFLSIIGVIVVLIAGVSLLWRQPAKIR